MMRAHWMDRLFLRVSPAHPCFESGWGMLEPYADVSLERLAENDPAPIRPRWSRVRTANGMWLREGRFESPVALLPRALRRGRVLWAGPENRAPAGVVVALAAWNDETFDFRLRLLAPLVRAGLAVIVPENPLYGARRLPGRRRGSPQTVEEFLQLGFGSVSEARGLLAGLRADGVSKTGVMGFSMGGHMAALTAASISWPTSVVAVAPSCSPSSVFVDGLLAAGTRFDALDDGEPGSGRVRLRRWLDRFSVVKLPPPPAVSRALILGTRRDGIVPPSEPERIAEHWRAELRWIDTGHVGAVTRHRETIRDAVANMFAR